MSKLVARALKCYEETDEAGSDDVYMVVFRGSFNIPSNVMVVGGKDTSWGNMVTGKAVVKDMVLDDSYSTENAYVIALLEQDDNRDILTDGAWGTIAEFWANQWHYFPNNAGREACASVALNMFGGVDNDELLGVRSISQIFANDGPGIVLDFKGDGGHYRARVVKRA